MLLQQRLPMLLLTLLLPPLMPLPMLLMRPLMPLTLLLML
jgi:hypothetical protein